MSRTRSGETGKRRLRLGRGPILAVLAVATQVGCTREFFREWANMDVSEAVFGKEPRPPLADRPLFHRAAAAFPFRQPL